MNSRAWEAAVMSGEFPAIHPLSQMSLHISIIETRLISSRSVEPTLLAGSSSATPQTDSGAVVDMVQHLRR